MTSIGTRMTVDLGKYSQMHRSSTASNVGKGGLGNEDAKWSVTGFRHKDSLETRVLGLFSASPVADSFMTALVPPGFIEGS